MLFRLILYAAAVTLGGSLLGQPATAPATATTVNAAPPASADWSEPFPPHHIIGNIYYVGSRGLASYLITTPAGHILINSNLKTLRPRLLA